MHMSNTNDENLFDRIRNKSDFQKSNKTNSNIFSFTKLNIYFLFHCSLNKCFLDQKYHFFFRLFSFNTHLAFLWLFLGSNGCFDLSFNILCGCLGIFKDCFQSTFKFIGYSCTFGTQFCA